MTEPRRVVTPPSGGQTDATVGPMPVGTQSAGEQARREFPAQVEAALAYAAENKYEYGPKFRRLELEHTVVGARDMGNGIARVTLEYRPANKFTGASGAEYFDIDSSGSVLARRQIRVPKESLPWVLMSLAGISAVVAAVLVVVILTTGEGGDPLYVAGRTLWVRAEVPKTQNAIYYAALDTEGVMRDWIILPAGEGTVLAMVKMTIINQTSGAVNLLIDQDAAELTTGNGLVHRPINPLERAQWPQGGIDPRQEVPDFGPIWASSVLEKGQQLVGYLVFEVPRGNNFNTLRWSATDTAIIRYQ